MREDLKYFKKADAVEALFKKCTRYIFPTTSKPIDEFIRLDDAVNRLIQIKCEDAEPVVRCKNCKWSGGTIGQSWCSFHEFTILSDDDFCSYGERCECDE